MSSQKKKSRKGAGKVKNLEPRGRAGKKGENVKGGGGTVLTATSLQTVDALAATYDTLENASKSLYDSKMTVISNLRG